MERSRMHSLWIRLIEFAVVVAILVVVTAVSMPRLHELVTHAAAVRDLENARIIYTSTSMLIAADTELGSKAFEDESVLKSLIGNIPETAQLKIDMANGTVASVAYMTAGSPGGLQIYPRQTE